MQVRTAHVSMEFGDSRDQHTHDAEAIFDKAVDRRYAWVTGTEAGASANNLGEELVRVGREAGYRLWVPSEQAERGEERPDGWLAVRNDLIKGDWKRDFQSVIPSANQLYRQNNVDPNTRGLPHWAAKGVISASFESIPKLGKISVGVSHHLTGGRHPEDDVSGGIDHYEWNEKLDREISRWMRESAKGSALAFFNCDRNASDRRSDQEIADATTLADELKAYQNTGHGDIDWMLSYNNDGRVSGRSFTVFDDSELFLHGDHYFCEGVFNVEPLRA